MQNYWEKWVAESGQSIALLVDSIPYMFHPLLAIVLVPLVIVGVIPLNRCNADG